MRTAGWRGAVLGLGGVQVAGLAMVGGRGIVTDPGAGPTAAQAAGHGAGGPAGPLPPAPVDGWEHTIYTDGFTLESVW